MKIGHGAIALGLAVGALAACGDDSQDSTFLPDAGDEPSVDAGPRYDALTVTPANAVLKVPLGGTVTQAYTVMGTIAGVTSDVTSSCVLGVTDKTFGGFAGPTFSASPRGGATTVVATCNGQTGSTGLTLVLTGSITQGGAPPSSGTIFAGATTGSDPAHTPGIEYPLDGAVAPLNIPSMDAQWTASQDDLFHLSWTSPHLALDVYTTAADAQLDDATWKLVSESTAGDAIAVAVEGLVMAAPATKYAGKPVTVTMSHDEIDNTAIYWWASSQSQLVTQTFGNTNAPASVRGDCTACHTVSRSGRRIGYSRCVANNCSDIFVGFLKFDTVKQVWTDTVDANAKALAGSYTAFPPATYPFPNDTSTVALVATKAGTLTLVDPDTGAAVASNVDTVATHDMGMPTRSATMPDWSPDGHSVVFASAQPGQWIDISGSAIAVMSYAYSGGTHTFGEPQFIVRAPITLSSGVYDNFFFPSYSPDGAVIVLDAARSAWRNFVNARSAGQRLMLAEPTGKWQVDLANLNGTGDLDVTWPHWAPTTSKDYYWVVFSSERDYGHKLTAASTNPACVGNGVTQCKQIWIGAIDKTKLKGAGDPSFAPVWMPGQDVSADNISPYWTLPTSAIPN